MRAASLASGETRTAADIDRRFQLLRWWRSTGVWPLGAQVACTTGRRLNPLSSWKTIQAPLARAFFYPGPSFVDPLFDGLVVALGRLAGRTLTAPAHVA